MLDTNTSNRWISKICKPDEKKLAQLNQLSKHTESGRHAYPSLFKINSDIPFQGESNTFYREL